MNKEEIFNVRTSQFARQLIYNRAYNDMFRIQEMTDMVENANDCDDFLESLMYTDDRSILSSDAYAEAIRSTDRYEFAKRYCEKFAEYRYVTFTKRRLMKIGGKDFQAYIESGAYGHSDDMDVFVFRKRDFNYAMFDYVGNVSGRFGIYESDIGDNIAAQFRGNYEIYNIKDTTAKKGLIVLVPASE